MNKVQILSSHIFDRTCHFKLRRDWYETRKCISALIRTYACADNAEQHCGVNICLQFFSLEFHVMRWKWINGRGAISGSFMYFLNALLNKNALKIFIIISFDLSVCTLIRKAWKELNVNAPVQKKWSKDKVFCWTWTTLKKWTERWTWPSEMSSVQVHTFIKLWLKIKHNPTWFTNKFNFLQILQTFYGIFFFKFQL